MRVDELERELRAERQEPDPEFARRLDDRAAAGFPRDRGLGPRAARGGGRSDGARRLWERISSVSPRRVLMPVGAVTTALVIGGVVIGQLERIGGSADDTADSGSPALESAGGEQQGGVSAAENPARQTDAGRTADEAAAAQEYDLGPLPAIGDGGGIARGTGGIARGTDERIVDATARVTLGAEADEVQDVANEVVAVTDRYKGVVLDSQVTTDQGGARAAFTLEIPYKQLDAALDELSGLADVISRTEAGEDITASAVRARKDLADTFDRIRKARIELIQADRQEERLIIKSQISSLEAQADAFEAQLNNVKRQGRFAAVNVDVTSNGGESGGDWSLSDALDDAGRVLEVIGGIALVSLAVLMPLALVGALVWLIASRSQRRQRERALDQ